MNIWCDRLVTGGILLLILVTPFAFGSVHPWAYSLMEAIIFLLMVVWMVRIIVVRGTGLGVRGSKILTPHASRLTLCVLPLTLFFALVIFQLMPLPPAVVRIFSPQTYEFYTQALPGWPERVPYADLPVALASAGQKSEVGNSGSLLPAPRSQPLLARTWLPLSVAPDRTRTVLLKFAAYGALFFLILLYPFGEPTAQSNPRLSTLNTRHVTPEPLNASSASRLIPYPLREEQFVLSVLLVILFTGALVAAIGLVQQFSWNGKILWYFVPSDWGVARPGGVPRASGPFVNPNHFANYLALIFPVAVACALFQNYLVSESGKNGLRIFSVLTACLLFTGILLSLSRSSWVSAFLGLFVLFCLSQWRSQNREQGAGSEGDRLAISHRPYGRNEGRFASSHERSGVISNFLRHPRRGGATVAAAVLFVASCLLVVSLFAIGPTGRGQVDSRLNETVTQDAGLWGRTVLWKDTIPMIRDFALFGVGLGAWPEMFPRYRRAPWSADFYRETHNDYIQILAETGVAGFALLGWFFIGIMRPIFNGVNQVSPTRLALLAALVAALGGMAFHEFFDFNLHIPANAFLCTVFFALALRIARSREQGALSTESEIRHSTLDTRHSKSDTRNLKPETPEPASPLTPYPSRFTPYASPLTPVAVAFAALGVTACALRQAQTPYPYNLKEPASLAEAQDLILSHPTHAPYHLALLGLMGNDAPLSRQLIESKAALWIEPSNPYFRDFYAAAFFSVGKTDEGLTEIARSVADAPYLASHLYLNENFLSSLSPVEQQAVESGFKQALARAYPETLQNLADFYNRLGRFADQAALYKHAALAEKERKKKADLLLNAGVAYIQAKDAINAERVYREAITQSPSDPRPYQQLVTAIYADRKDLHAAKEVVAQGIRNGAPPVPLYLMLAEVAQKAQSPEDIKAALNSAKTEVERSAKNGDDPYPLYIELADRAREAGDLKLELAALSNALELKPRSPEILSRLANVYLEQGNFDRAALYLNRVASINANSADVYYQLAAVEEGRYRFADADKAYARAVELAPKNANYRQRYAAFKVKVDQSRRQTIPLDR